MKFAKQLKAAQQPEWKGQYVDYKLLKQKLHGFVRGSELPAADNPPADAADTGAPMTVSRLEELDDTFFMALRDQADKCESFYLHLVGQLRLQQQRVFFEDYQRHAYGSTASAASPSVSPLPSPLYGGPVVSPLSGSSPADAIPSPLASSPGMTAQPLTPDAVVAFGKRAVTYAELNKLAVQKILKKHRKRFDAALATVQSANPQLLGEVRERSLAVEKGILDTLRRSRAFWTRRDLEAILEEIKAFRWQHVKEQAHLLKCAIP